MIFKRIAPGLYKSIDQSFEIERLDRSAEFYPGDDYYNKWRVYDFRIEGKQEIWLYHFNTLADAKEAIRKSLT